MARIKSGLFLLSAVVLGASISAAAQSGQAAPPKDEKEAPPSVGIDQAPSGHFRIAPVPFIPSGLPFAIDGKGSERSIRILSEAEMTREDRDLFADAESSIQERAGIQNLEFNGPGWTYQELVCPALPKHLFLRFTRDDGTRQMSMFSAAIPRDGNGRVRIIPIVRKGYSLFSPAPVGALTIAAFNRIRVEEGAGTSANWLGTGLCYAALAGANPDAGEPIKPDTMEIPATMPPTLTTLSEGGAIVRFVDISATPHAMEWTLTFDSKGKLLKAAHTPAAVTGPPKRVGGADAASQAKD